MNLFPLLKDCETIPWWAGIAYKIYDTHSYRLAPIGLNWLIAWTLVLRNFIRYPYTAFALLKHDDVGRLVKVQLENYRLKIDLGDARVALREQEAARISAEMERDQLKVALEASLRDRLTTQARDHHQKTQQALAAQYQYSAANAAGQRAKNPLEYGS